MEIEYYFSVQDLPYAKLSVQADATEFARVNADGTCFIDWEKCEKIASEWEPHGEMYQAIAKLLIHARQTF